MTVAELIEKLKELPQDYKVIVFDGIYQCYDDADCVTVNQQNQTVEVDWGSNL